MSDKRPLAPHDFACIALDAERLVRIVFEQGTSVATATVDNRYILALVVGEERVEELRKFLGIDREL